MNHISSYKGWHSPLASSLPYMSSVDSYTERGIIMSMGMSPLPYDDMNELQYPLDEEIASSTEHIQSMSSSTEHIKIESMSSSTEYMKPLSISSRDDGSDEEIDEIRRAIDKTLGSKEDEIPQNINPRAKYLAQLGIGKKTSSQQVTQPITRKLSSSQSSQRTPRTPPTSPVSDNDDSLDAMLALMGVSDDITIIPHVIRSSPIDIPRKVSPPIPIPSRHTRPMPRPHVPIISKQSHKYDSDDDEESYFDSPQSEDLSGSMLFDY